MALLWGGWVLRGHRWGNVEEEDRQGQVVLGPAIKWATLQVERDGNSKHIPFLHDLPPLPAPTVDIPVT